MQSLNIQLNRLVGELIGVLDADVSRLVLSLERLDGLRAGVIRRDEEALKLLLDDIACDEVDQMRLERKRKVICVELAAALGCSESQMNLSRLCACLPEEISGILADKQRQLKELVERMQVEHLRTSLLLRECSRLNKSLLHQIMGSGKGAVTYNARGNTSWQAEKGMVSLRV